MINIKDRIEESKQNESQWKKSFKRLEQWEYDLGNKRRSNIAIGISEEET